MIGFNNLGNMGRLGNQMFEYAALRGIAANKGYDWCIPPFTNKGIENYSLDRAFTLPSVTRTNLKLLDNGYAPVVGERQFHFDEELFNLCPNEISLNGFFQTEKYFKNIEEEIRDDFTFRQEIRSECDELAEDAFEEPIALHIRRGDFLKNSGNHHNLELDYYKQALNQFNPKQQVVIFSDDPQWCLEQELFEGDRFMVSSGNGPYHDLYLMSLCSDFIIANSTFSWWGAWLANRGTVVAPKKWFGPNNEHLSTKDLYPASWKII